MKGVRFLLALTLAFAPRLTSAEVAAGDRGYGVTVLHGNATERFEIEILGRLHDVFAKTDIILGRVSGAGLENTGIIAGMSGSPIYVDGELIGALAYGWSFAKEPICGITPIAAMRAIPTGGSVRPPAPDLAMLVADDFLERFDDWLTSTLPVAPTAGGSLVSPRLPLAAAGWSAATMARFAPQFAARGWQVAGAATGAAPAAPTVPGGAVAAGLVDGDLSMAAVGTVTAVDGQRVLAFGHPFLGLGEVELPLYAAEVVTVLPSLDSSFKFGVAGDEIGVVVQDRNAGVAADLGRRAVMLPVAVDLVIDGKTNAFHYRVARHPSLAAFLVAMTADSTLTTFDKSMGPSTIALSLRAETPAGVVEYRDLYSGPSARNAVASTASLLTGFLSNNSVGGTAPTALALRLEVSNRWRAARILRLETPAKRFRAGDHVPLRVQLKEDRGENFVAELELVLPADSPRGRAAIVVGGGRALTAIDLATVPPDPRRPSDLLALLRRLQPANRLGAALFRPARGALVGGQALTSLPPTVRALLGTGLASPSEPPLRAAAAATAWRDLDLPIEGIARLDLEIE